MYCDSRTVHGCVCVCVSFLQSCLSSRNMSQSEHMPSADQFEEMQVKQSHSCSIGQESGQMFLKSITKIINKYYPVLSKAIICNVSFSTLCTSIVRLTLLSKKKRDKNQRQQLKLLTWVNSTHSVYVHRTTQ